MSGIAAVSCERNCGACTACCTQLPLTEGAPALGGAFAPAACKHVGALGCRCYDRRPASCAAFVCAWLADPAWPAAWRPDRSGVLCLRGVHGGSLAAEVHEVRPGALESPAAGEIVAALHQATALVTLIDLNHRQAALVGAWRKAG